jgi:hypothetical protein
MAGSDHYEVIYNVNLLDDIHNYFPDLLYNSGRFTTITQVFHYVRQRMNARFNLFSYGASRYAANPESVIPDIIEIFSPVPITHLPRTTRFVPEDTNTLLLNVLGIGTGHAFLAREDMIRQNTQLNNFNDIIVRPTAVEIENSTEIINGASLTEETSCAVCQDSIVAADTCRKIRHCNHTYHQTCIDLWFQRSVFCPTCRHDVRLVA